MTIRAKLIAMILVVFISISTMAGVTYFRGKSILSDFLTRAGTELVVGSAEALRKDFDKQISLVDVATAFLEKQISQQGFTDEDLENLLVDTQKKMAQYGVMQLVVGFESDGRAKTSTRWKTPEGYDARTRPWYKEVKEAPKGQVTLTEPYLDLETKIPVITAASSLYSKEGKLVACLAVDIKLDEIQEYVLGRRIFGQGTGIMLSKSGLVAVHSNKDFALKTNLATGNEFPEALHSLARRMVAGETGMMDYTFEGQDRRVFFAPVGRGFFLGIFFPVSFIQGVISSLTGILLIISAIALVVTGAFIFVILRALSRSLSNMTAVTARLGQGDLTSLFDDRGRDELSRISRSLNAMVGSVSNVLVQIHQEAGMTSQQAETLAALSEETLASMEEVAASVERVNSVVGGAAAAIEETNASISEIATSAQSSAQSSTDGAAQSSAVAQDTTNAVSGIDKVVQGMKEAERNSEQTKERIKELAQDVNAISGFVNTITSIADQTNLLALNAAIEAARAGEAGRGFAVVAEEVRKLAEESGQAAQQVNKLISTLQRHSSDSLTATDQTVSLIVNVVKEAEIAEEGLRGALDSTQKLSEVIQNIAAVSEEQAASSEEISNAMRDVANANGEIVSSTSTIHTSTQETTKAAESIATSAQSMAETAEKLQRLIGTFTLDHGSSSKAMVPGK